MARDIQRSLVNLVIEDEHLEHNRLLEIGISVIFIRIERVVCVHIRGRNFLVALQEGL